MRRSLLAFAATATFAVVAWTPTNAWATHSCAPEFQVVCWAGCPNPPKLCPWP